MCRRSLSLLHLDCFAPVINRCESLSTPFFQFLVRVQCSIYLRRYMTLWLVFYFLSNPLSWPCFLYSSHNLYHWNFLTPLFPRVLPWLTLLVIINSFSFFSSGVLWLFGVDVSILPLVFSWHITFGDLVCEVRPLSPVVTRCDRCSGLIIPWLLCRWPKTPVPPVSREPLRQSHLTTRDFGLKPNSSLTFSPTKTKNKRKNYSVWTRTNVRFPFFFLGDCLLTTLSPSIRSLLHPLSPLSPSFTDVISLPDHRLSNIKL